MSFLSSTQHESRYSSDPCFTDEEAETGLASLGRQRLSPEKAGRLGEAAWHHSQQDPEGSQIQKKHSRVSSTKMRLAFINISSLHLCFIPGPTDIQYCGKKARGCGETQSHLRVRRMVLALLGIVL